ncbi:hypothetical protein PoB_006177700 [Plakobranchus ocellatus]|uniref:ZAD domain-containing protein n=1 Tax=Plakobranchus ocellatus TaxID=259542 RepID=A0AAV4CTQ6_9GAST|nr:hypothetical protein PoB_006177700 [Plakobranchus ocellatus]
MEEHTENLHKELFNELCRTCGGRTLTKKQKLQKRKPYKCADFEKEILLAFNVSVDKGDINKHSAYICRTCVNIISTIKKHFYAGTILRAKDLIRSSAHIWTLFKADTNISDCPSCTHHISGGTAFGRKITNTSNTIPNMPSKETTVDIPSTTLAVSTSVEETTSHETFLSTNSSTLPTDDTVEQAEVLDT